MATAAAWHVTPTPVDTTTCDAGQLAAILLVMIPISIEEIARFAMPTAFHTLLVDRLLTLHPSRTRARHSPTAGTRVAG